LKNEEALQTVKEERNILYKIKRRKANWIGHIMCRNWLVKHVTEGGIEGKTEMTRDEEEEEDVSSYWIP
jgi:hypothetical protein